MSHFVQPRMDFRPSKSTTRRGGGKGALVSFQRRRRSTFCLEALFGRLGSRSFRAQTCCKSATTTTRGQGVVQAQRSSSKSIASVRMLNETAARRSRRQIAMAEEAPIEISGLDSTQLNLHLSITMPWNQAFTDHKPTISNF